MRQKASKEAKGQSTAVQRTGAEDWGQAWGAMGTEQAMTKGVLLERGNTQKAGHLGTAGKRKNQD